METNPIENVRKATGNHFGKLYTTPWHEEKKTLEYNTNLKKGDSSIHQGS